MPPVDRLIRLTHCKALANGDTKLVKGNLKILTAFNQFKNKLFMNRSILKIKYSSGV